MVDLFARLIGTALGRASGLINTVLDAADRNLDIEEES